METNEYKKVFSLLELPMEEKDRIWNNIDRMISDAGEEKKEQRNCFLNKHTFFFKAASVILLLGCVFALANEITGSKLAKAIASFWNINSNSQDVISDNLDYHVTLDTCYAPEIIEYSDKRLVFGGTFGLVIYDRIRDCVTGTIDLQSIECNYFNTDTLETRFIVKNDRLSIYNLKSKKVYGMCYEYDLSQCQDITNKTVLALEPTRIQEASQRLEKQWKKCCVKARKETFQTFNDSLSLFYGRMYSAYSRIYTDGEGNRFAVCLVLGGTGKNELIAENDSYQIIVYRKNMVSKEIQTEILNLDIFGSNVTSNSGVDLPKYKYHGDSQIEKAMVECFYNNLSLYEGYMYGGKEKLHDVEIGSCDVVIPSVDVVASRKEKKHIKAIGSFCWQGYSLSGNTLYESHTGGGGIAVIYLQVIDSQYQVEKVVHPRDGAFFYEDLYNMYDEDADVVRKVLNKEYLKTKVRILKEYVKQNNLDIKYYKATGWDPERIG